MLHYKIINIPNHENKEQKPYLYFLNISASSFLAALNWFTREELFFLPFNFVNVQRFGQINSLEQAHCFRCGCIIYTILKASTVCKINPLNGHHMLGGNPRWVLENSLNCYFCWRKEFNLDVSLLNHSMTPMESYILNGINV